MASESVAPNPFPQRPLSPDFWIGYEEYFEWLSSHGRPRGLLSLEGKRTALPYLDPADVVRLDEIHARGERGLPIHAGPGEPCEIDPFDASVLPVGRHDLYACLAKDKVECGELLEVSGFDGNRRSVLGLSGRGWRVVLASGEDRVAHRDWIKIAVLERVPGGSGVATILDERFHPAITDLRAYGRPNPLIRFAELGLQMLEAVNAKDEDARLTSELRTELVVLRSVSDEGDPRLPFTIALRCVQLIRSMNRPALLMDGRLEGYKYSPETVGRFLFDLHKTVTTPSDPLPPEVEIDGDTFLRLPEQLQEDAEMWRLDTSTNGFVANAIAIYLPMARPGSIPEISYSSRRFDDGNFLVAKSAEDLSAAGSAFVLGELPVPVGTLYLTVNSDSVRQRLSQYIGDIHAVYYK